MSEDLLIRRALQGYNKSSIIVNEGVGAPVIEVRSAVSVRDAKGHITGIVMTSLNLGSAFVDGIKHSTGLDSSIYAGDVMAATTILNNDGKTRATGISTTDQAVQKQVLQEGKSHKTALDLQNREVLGAFLPLKDVDNATVGMLLVAQPQITILQAAGKSVELTFLITAVLLVLSIPPIYFITRGIVKQI